MGAIRYDKNSHQWSHDPQFKCVFHNESDHRINVNVNEGDKLVETDFGNMHTNFKTKEYFYLFFHVKALAVYGKYSNLYQLTLLDMHGIDVRCKESIFKGLDSFVSSMQLRHNNRLKKFKLS